MWPGDGPEFGGQFSEGNCPERASFSEGDTFASGTQDFDQVLVEI